MKMDYNELLNNGTKYLKKNNIKNPKLDCELLLSKVLNKKREEILINSNTVIKKQEMRRYHDYLLRRKQNEPIAYILGYKYFWKYKFITNKTVLIPRPDTELLIEESLKYLPKVIFEADKSFDYAQKIESILAHSKSGNKNDY